MSLPRHPLLLPRLSEILGAGGPSGGAREAVRFGDAGLAYAELAGAAAAVAERVAGAERVAAWAVPRLETAVAVTGALLAGVPVVPVNPGSGERELAHVVADSSPALILAPPGAELPPALRALPREDVDVAARGSWTRPEPPPHAPALVVYTSGTTGAPKGVVLPRRALAFGLDALAQAWAWTPADALTHGLPLFHVHGLVLGVLGPLRLGGAVRHVGRFSPEAVAAELASGATMLFGVPTMYRRLAAAAEEDPEIAAALAGARLLVSGSAALPPSLHERVERLTGTRVVERYGMTETLMITAVRAAGDRRPGTVGPPLDGVDVRLAGEDGEVQVRSPSLFLEYLNRPDATAQAFSDDGWFRTGDVAVRDDDGALRLIGRQATDLIKSGGFKIGAGEIEDALGEHPGVAEAAVTGESDEDLGERVVAWVVPAPGGAPPTERELADHVARLLSAHKRPRTVRFVDALPRNDLGKVQKSRLRP